MREMAMTAMTPMMQMTMINDGGSNHDPVRQSAASAPQLSLPYAQPISQQGCWWRRVGLLAPEFAVYALTSYTQLLQHLCCPGTAVHAYNTHFHVVSTSCRALDWDPLVGLRSALRWQYCRYPPFHCLQHYITDRDVWCPVQWLQCTRAQHKLCKSIQGPAYSTTWTGSKKPKPANHFSRRLHIMTLNLIESNQQLAPCIYLLTSR